MARKVYLHIGLPKTGTSYLQTILWSNRDRLTGQGLLLPGAERRDHLWSSLVVREDPEVADRNPRAPGAWDRVRAEIAAWSDDALVSHEFFAAATAEQAAAAIAQLAPAEVHLVVTARETLGLFTASWQESVKNKETARIEDYSREVSEDPLVVWNWRALDLGLVLDRWTRSVPADRVHVLPLPGPDAPQDLLWQRFAGVVGVDPDTVDLSQTFGNQSMGVAETETLRRVNEVLEDFETPFDKGVWIRTYLADERLVPRHGDRYWPGPDQIEDCRRVARESIALVRERGFQVVGDLDDLVPADTLPDRRHPSSVTDAEVAEVAVHLVASMLADVRRLTRELRTARREAQPADRVENGSTSRGRRALRALRRVTSTSRES